MAITCFKTKNREARTHPARSKSDFKRHHPILKPTREIVIKTAITMPMTAPDDNEVPRATMVSVQQKKVNLKSNLLFPSALKESLSLIFDTAQQGRLAYLPSRN